MQNKKTIIALGAFLLFMVAWFYLKTFLFPHALPTTEPIPEPERAVRNAAAVAAAGPFVNYVPEPERVDRPITQPAQKIALGVQIKAMSLPGAVVVQPQKTTPQFVLGSRDPASKYHLYAVLDARGAGVREVVLNKFQAVDAQGQPEWEDPETKKIRKLETLIPPDPTGALSYLLYHFELKGADKDVTGEQPLETLGNVEWKVVAAPAPASGEPIGEQRVVFQTQVGGVVVQKVFTLAEGTYHVGLEVKMFKADAADKNERWFRYQLAGAHGLPIEGRWYTNVFRNALIAEVDKGNKNSVYRTLQDARLLALKDGGDEVLRDAGRFIRYAAVAIQYFTSAIVVDDEQDKQDFLSRARPTLEWTTVKGTIKSMALDDTSLVLVVGEHDERTVYVTRETTKEVNYAPGVQIGVIYRTDGRGRAIAVRILPHKETQPLFENDVTVRVATEPVSLKEAVDEDHAVVHKYLLYNGPMKAMLLGHMRDPATVSDPLVDRYVNKLNLNSLVDYQSPGVVGTFASSIGWTWLVIHTTNLMHLVLGLLSSVIPSYGLCIIVLTILVRGCMFPVSRKAALTNLRMQELQPEIKKLKEKYKDDPMAMNRALMDLNRKSGVNPLSTCWMMFLQMPIFMGLYYALQESIHFRAAAFWPTWITNLGAPDMLIPWGSSIPYISAPESYGNFFWLGPYFNVMPVLAVTLMIFQQKYTMPPPTDEQQQMQQKMMKYMMAFMGLMFYKVPSGLVLYFIASSVWGFCERKLLPKKKKPVAGFDVKPKTGFMQNLLSKATGSRSDETGVTTGPATAVTTGNGSPRTDGKGRGRNRGGKNKRRSDRATAADAGMPTTEDGSVFGRLGNWWRERRERLNNWWQKLQDEAQKKNR